MERKIYSYLLFIWSVLAMVFVLTVLLSGSVVHAEEARTVTVNAPTALYKLTYNQSWIVNCDASGNSNGTTMSVSGVTGKIGSYSSVIEFQNGQALMLLSIWISDQNFDGATYDSAHGYYYMWKQWNSMSFSMTGATIVSGSSSGVNMSVLKSSNSDQSYCYTVMKNYIDSQNIDFSKKDMLDEGSLEDNLVPDFDPDQIYITGFECDNTVHATWTGVNLPEGYSINDVTIKVLCGYMPILREGENSMAEFDHPADEEISAASLSWSRPLSDYYENNPYDGQCLLNITFIPYLDGEKGKATRVTFDFDKKMDITVPDGALVGSSSPELYFLNPSASSEFHNDFDNCWVYFRWTGVSVENVVSYMSSDILIELYCKSPGTDQWAWIKYDDGDIRTFKDRFIKLNPYKLGEYVSSNTNYAFSGTGITSVDFTNEKIKITPCYRTGSEEIKGRPVIIELNTLGGVKAFNQSNLDGTTTDLNGGTGFSGAVESFLSVAGSGSGEGSDSEFDVSDLGSLTIRFFEMLKTLFQACGSFPSLVANVFSFLPSYYTYMLTVGLGAVIILRLLGR